MNPKFTMAQQRSFYARARTITIWANNRTAVVYRSSNLEDAAKFWLEAQLMCQFSQMEMIVATNSLIGPDMVLYWHSLGGASTDNLQDENPVQPIRDGV